jgi:hypothetical protein
MKLNVIRSSSTERAFFPGISKTARTTYTLMEYS